jgi:xylan 1,4-beta-xylosidase
MKRSWTTAKTGIWGIFVSSAVLFTPFHSKAQRKQPKTFCNPVNLPYNFQTSGNATYREAADPTVVIFKGKYWLFASKQKGYWWSDDMLSWKLIEPQGLPLDVYAPSVTIVNNKMIFFGGNNTGAFTTDDPFTGKWTHINSYAPGCIDPDLFIDTDGKAYLYNGCSNVNPIQVVQMDVSSFLPVGTHLPLINADTKAHGWEVPGDNNTEVNAKPWIEGSFMNKIGGKYYLQYAGPGTQYKSYADGVYVADKATGPFVYADYSPFSFKPTGFITGAGHSSTFADKRGQYWHIATGTISVRHMFERRLVLFPAFLTADGQLATNTYLGDYPQYIPALMPQHSLMTKGPGWMLLTYNKKAAASSALDGKDIDKAFDEDIRTWWSAKSGNAGEWLTVDMSKICTVNAVQVNFADEGANAASITQGDGYRYYVEASANGRQWHVIINHKTKSLNAPHDYIELPEPVKARYLRITNVHSPAATKFSISGLRAFGIAAGSKPAVAKGIEVMRDKENLRSAIITWSPVERAEFYIVRYGIAPDKLFSVYQVYNSTTVTMNALNANVNYYFTVDAVNASGITPGSRPAVKY